MFWGYSVRIREDDLSGADVRALLKFHIEDAYNNSPADGVFTLDIAALQKPDITFWTIWDDGALCGFGALKKLSTTHGEIKSMRTEQSALGQGVASQMLIHIMRHARLEGFKRLSLETGPTAPYAPARNLYAKFGFKPCGPFADYKKNAFSVFMSRGL